MVFNRSAQDAAIVLGLALAVALGLPTVSAAQAPDMSPTLLIETGPSDNPDYRRMIFVKYLSGDAVTVNYKAYNRTEFIQVEGPTPAERVIACTRGEATTLDEIIAYNRAEAQKQANKTAPDIQIFCIKNVPNWNAGNQKTYLDPIFDGMPHAARLNTPSG